MKIVIQRVSESSVMIETNIVGKIGKGLLILCGFEPFDTSETLQRMLHKCLHYRIFSDAQGKMNLSLKDIQGGLLLVPQFTLLADTDKGLRPGFSNGASPLLGQTLFNELMALARQHHPFVEQGHFGQDMQVRLCNDGPVTFILKF